MKVSEIKKNIVSQKTECLRIYFNDDWKANEIAILYSSINKLYKFYSKLDYVNHQFNEHKKSKVKYADKSHSPIHFLINHKYLLSCFGDEMSNRLLSFDKFDLVVKSIKMNSPGFTDLVGISGIIGHLKDALFYYLPNKKTNKEIELLELKKQELLIKNLKEIGINSIELKQIILNEEIYRTNIKELIQNEKIVSLELKKN